MEADAFAADHGLPAGAIHRIDVSKSRPHRRAQVLEVLAGKADLGLVAFFCHGLSRSMQLGFDISTAGTLSEAITLVSKANVTVPLYLCSTAKGGGAGGDGGFADELRDALCRDGARQCQVDAPPNREAAAVTQPRIRTSDAS